MIIAKKYLGQNFLINHQIIDEIVKLIPLNTKKIIEIGPGTGNLTKVIIQKFPNTEYLAIEKDTQFTNILHKISANKLLKVQYVDVLTINWQDILDKETVIIGNLPYNISTKIIFSILESFSEFQKLIFVLQQEVAEKITAIKKKDRMSVLINLLCKTHNEMMIGRENFDPVPNVESSVVSFTANYQASYNEYLKLKNIIHLAYKYKRKKLSNNQDFLNIIHEYDKTFDGNLRAEDINTSQLLAMIKNHH